MDFSIISSLKSIKEERECLYQAEKKLSTPILRDMSLIPELYSYYRKLYPIPGGRQRISLYNKYFVFSIIYLYSPNTLAGNQIKNGLREKIAETVGINNGTRISQLCANLAFDYETYKDFRDTMDNVYNELTSWLRAKELIK
ncbi:hypothetical protein [Phocaeicola paurosaccharolyticus]|uniref:hypothetical protein n=1 Tax=Phocaeicola paurosaccharolyticus TaxID=732242 RepID=UPI0011DE169A|nr:hypothetical protein [Phocaeicola paurosaccharolyticus]